MNRLINELRTPLSGTDNPKAQRWLAEIDDPSIPLLMSFEIVLLYASAFLFLLAFMSAMQGWQILNIVDVLLEGILLSVYFWFVWNTFSLKQLFRVKRSRQRSKASKQLAQAHLLLLFLQISFFLIAWILLFRSWMGRWL